MVHVLLLQPLAGAGKHSDWLQQNHALLQISSTLVRLSNPALQQLYQTRRSALQQ